MIVLNSAALTIWGPYRVREIQISRYMEVTRYLSVYSTMFQHKHSHIVIDDIIQIHIQENAARDDTHESTAYNDKQELHHTMTYQKYRP